MVNQNRKRAVALGVRIGVVFLLSICVIVFLTYYVMSRNMYNQLTEYSIGLIQSMADQGVQTVESELELERKAISLKAASFQVPAEGQAIKFPQDSVTEQVLRTLYVSDEGTVSSDGRRRDVSGREDVRAALGGETAVYGPYFNEENEYVVCYTAPVTRDGAIVGALSVEKDGFRFCELIKNIRFFETGESYMLNAEGTDIAVSDPNHISWVTEQYNSQALYAAGGDEETKLILDLELKALAGERGVGTYYWNDGLVYVIYVPISSEGWVLLAGMREEEISSITQTTLFTSLSKGPVLKLSLLTLVLLTGLIILWIVGSAKKNAEINEKLEVIANHDAMTGLLNRRYLETGLAQKWRFPVKIPCEAAVFMSDIDDFKLYNDTFGHPSGDDCLRRVATLIKGSLEGLNSYAIRYGGEEFVAAVFLIDRQAASELGERICRLVEDAAMPDGRGGIVTISVGVFHVSSTLKVSLFDCIQGADQALYQAKKDGKNRVVVTGAPDMSPGSMI
ncbi:hypothetical protein CE91St41_17690 [Oscillospiraceae bacterium]|nr:hypothetical protein CE91St40_19850 [Oscillospiraceae bacterium]BDF74880.1 hypothetical protein CE91St41_17690 [Oscillospiraceae bacterium]